MNERRIHQFFEISILFKGAHALIECVGGILLAAVDTGTIIRWVETLTQDELLEDPSDFIARHVHAMVQTYTPSTQHFYAFYLLSHGVVKLFLVAGLLRDRLWAYPASLVVLSLFIVYQLYRYSYTGGVGLLALTVFDVVVIGLIWHEWRVRRGLKTFTTSRQA